MSQQLQPSRVLSPGHILKRELEAREWTQNDLATIMGRPSQTISEIVRGMKQITPETAIELADALGTSPDFWLSLETNYRLFLARKRNKTSDENPITRKSRLYNLVPVGELMKRGWIRQTNAINELEQEVCGFLRISTPEQSPQLTANFRCSEKLGPETNARIAWLQRVHNLVEQQQVSSFDLEDLRKALPNLIRFAEQAEQVKNIPQFLQELGVHIVFVPHISKTYIDGAAFFIKDNPVIAMSLRYDRIDAFWFTLMHELAHIVLEHEGLYLDELDDKDLQKEEAEIEANRQARDWIIEPTTLDNFVTQVEPNFSQKKIERFAMENKIHPGIVLGRLQHEGLVKYNKLRNLLVKVKPYLNSWIDVPFHSH
jgi:HTH-type transcriptional regulator / antitoxin HigA